MSKDTVSRLPNLSIEDMTHAQRKVHDVIVAGPRGEVAGPLKAWLNSPDLAERAQALGQYARYDSHLPEKMSELAILVTGRIWGSGFEWAHHVPIALRAGIPEDVVEKIAHARRVSFDDPVTQAVFDCCVELHRDRQISDATYARGHSLLGSAAMVDMVGICGYYTLISMTINAFHVPDGEGPKLPALDKDIKDYFRD